MFTLFKKIKDWVSGYKTYILGTVAIVSTVVAWSAGEITGVQCVTAIFIALQSMFIRAGIKKAEID